VVDGLEDVAGDVAEGVYAGAAESVGPDAAVGVGSYAGGGSFDGTVKAFMPGLSGRLVGGLGFVRGLGLLRGISLVWAAAASSAGPLKLDVAGV